MATITSLRAASPANGIPRIQSPSIADTPTSSTRGSIELNPRPHQAPSGPRRGNRAALRDYYNLKAKAQSSGPGQLSRTASITSTTSEVSSIAPSVSTLTDPVDTVSSLTAQLDNQDFDPQAYISDLLATSSLKDILRVEATLVSEIRNLDGERKALVYDNYSKLIKAVQTIGEMQRSMNEKGGLSEIGDLEAKMDRLRAMVKELAHRDENEVQANKRRRDQRQQMKEQTRKKELVLWVLATPDRLSKLLAEGKREDAEIEWERVQEYLKRWQGVKGVAEVKQSCEEVMAVTDDEETAG